MDLQMAWKQAAGLNIAARREADAVVNGDRRARTQFEGMRPESRTALRSVVTQQLGTRAWRDYEDQVIRPLVQQRQGV
jgi:hypothetical protein